MSNITFAENLQIDVTSELDLLAIVNGTLESTYYYLSNFRNDAGYTEKLGTAFGNDFDGEIANQLFMDFSQGNFSEIPEIKILSDDVLGETNGAYSAQKNEIYLNQRFLTENAEQPQAIAAVLIEEIGHFVDAQINTVDSAGDEGDIFARLVFGEEINSETLGHLKAEDDTKTIILDGEEVLIEQFEVHGDNEPNDLRAAWLGAFNDQIYGKGGNDTLRGGNGHDSLDGGTGDDILYGDSANDTLVGGNGNDTLTGGSGNDILLGGSGRDRLVGDAGQDILTGGSNADNFIFRSHNDIGDIITDFNRAEGDIIEIYRTGFVGSAATKDQFSYNATNNALYFEQEQIATLDNVSSFNVNTDIVLVL